jgi:ABC-type antimicrobial peptide transport system permease subunit
MPDYFEQSPGKVDRGAFFTTAQMKPVDSSAVENAVKGVMTDLYAQTTTPAATTTKTSDGTLPLVDIGGTTADQAVSKTIDLTGKVSNVAVINKAMLPILGISDSATAINKNIEFSAVVSPNQTGDTVNYVTTQMTYKIVGVIVDDTDPALYIPFNDMKSAGVVDYSTFKVSVDNESNMNIARKQIEALGFSTMSILDTIVQVNSIFSSVNVVLAIIGMMALLVASLGMFNTLTVSLLERTREVGLLKALGMKSREVRDLFLAESLIMGLEGGVIGLLLGTVAGKLVGLLVSALFITKNGGIVSAYVPFELVTFIAVLALFVGISTGVYPARRAMKISALDALRYE